jgi:predicted DCC family thiol-disulfide oxidoreductase YuxK
VVYDAGCGLCTRLREWIVQQEALVRVEFVPGGSPDALQRFGPLPPGELAVIGYTGEVWLGDRAWIVCLWALREYRDLAVRLSSPLLLTLAREAFSIVSKNRKALSDLLQLRSEQEWEEQLKRAVVTKCQSRK